MTPFVGFAPDLDPTTLGVITSCSQVIPTLKGVAGAPTALDAGFPALAAACRGANVMNRLDNQRRVFAGAQAALYELSGSVWADVSKVGGYTGGTENVWRFAQFGNVSLAANTVDKIQASTTGAFADITQAPKARIIETASGFVLAYATNDPTNGDLPDGWACSGIYDHVTWTPGPSTQASNGRLLDTPGEIRAAKRLGTNVAVYKETSMYLGQYVGPPIVWAHQVVSSSIGALSQECVIDTGTAHLFISRDDFCVFDGSAPRSLNAPVREWFFKNSDPTYRYKTKGYYDRFSGRAWWFYASKGSSGALTDAIVYNTKSDKWGYAQISVQTVLDYTPPDTTWDNWPPGPATDYENIADLPFDSPAFDTDQPALAIFGTDSKLKTLVGPCAGSTIITGDFGDDTQFTTITAVKPRFIARPGSSSITNYTKEYADDEPALCNISAINGNKYDVLSSGRYHRLKFDHVGDYEMVGYAPDLVPDGEA